MIVSFDKNMFSAFSVSENGRTPKMAVTMIYFIDAKETNYGLQRKLLDKGKGTNYE